MISRVLPPEEWPRLAGTEAETLWPMLPTSARVIVVEEDGLIVATWVLYQMAHAECLWIDPARRGSFGVTRRLLSKMREEAALWGVGSVLTGATDEHVADLITRLGGDRLPGAMFNLPVGRFGKMKAKES